MPSITRRPPRTREEPGKVERRVLETVERLLEGGASYTELGIVQIAADAGVARSTFYVHYRDKSDLLIRLTEAATERLFAVSEDWVLEKTGSDAADELRTAIREVIREYRDHAPLLGALAEVAGYDPEVETFWAGKVEGFAAGLESRVQEEQAAGEARQDIDPAMASRVVAWAVERNLARHVVTDGGAGDDALAATLARMMWATLYGER